MGAFSGPDCVSAGFNTRPSRCSRFLSFRARGPGPGARHNKGRYGFVCVREANVASRSREPVLFTLNAVCEGSEVEWESLRNRYGVIPSEARCLRSGRVCGARDLLFDLPRELSQESLRALENKRDSNLRKDTATSPLWGHPEGYPERSEGQQGICCFLLDCGGSTPLFRRPAKSGSCVNNDICAASLSCFTPKVLWRLCAHSSSAIQTRPSRRTQLVVLNQPYEEGRGCVE